MNISGDKPVAPEVAEASKFADALVELAEKVRQSVGELAVTDNRPKTTLEVSSALHGATFAISAIQRAVERYSTQPIPEEALAEDLELEDEPEYSLDDDETFEIARRFTLRKLGFAFTIGELQEHLEKNGVVIPSAQKLRVYFELWREDIVYDLRELGTDGRWMEFPVGKQKGWVFAEVTNGKKSEAPKTIPRAPKPIAKEAEVAEDEPAEQAGEDTDKILLERTIMIVMQIVNEPIARRFVIAAAEERGYDTTIISHAIQSLVEEGKLYAYRQGGRSMLTKNPRDVPEKRTTGSQQTQRAASAEQTTLETDLDLAVSVVSIFLQPGRHVSQQLTTKEVLAILGRKQTASNSNQVKQLARQLRRTGIMVINIAPLNKGGHRSSSQQVLKVGLASQQVKEELLAVLQSGGLTSYLSGNLAEQDII